MANDTYIPVLNQGSESQQPSLEPTASTPEIKPWFIPSKTAASLYKALDAVTISRRSPSPKEIEAALKFISSYDRVDWISVGMALKNALGEAGRDLWIKWSMTAHNYDADAAKSSWKSFSLSGKVRIGTLFYLAKKNGYKPNRNLRHKPTLLSPEEVSKREAEIKAEADKQIARHKAAAIKAVTIWDGTDAHPSVNEHPYLLRKGVQAHGAKIYDGYLEIHDRECKGCLMLPMMLNGSISSLQFIHENGDKFILPGGKKGTLLIGEIVPDMPICIAEGFATGASIHEATGYGVLVAFDAGSFPIRAKEIRAKYPDTKIILCADTDEKWTGLRKATEAALAVDGYVVEPNFSNGASHE